MPCARSSNHRATAFAASLEPTSPPRAGPEKVKLVPQTARRAFAPRVCDQSACPSSSSDYADILQIPRDREAIWRLFGPPRPAPKPGAFSGEQRSVVYCGLSQPVRSELQMWLSAIPRFISGLTGIDIKLSYYVKVPEGRPNLGTYARSGPTSPFSLLLCALYLRTSAWCGIPCMHGPLKTAFGKSKESLAP
jgi:hypothetical protein